jgi:hypothetical protein
VTGMQTARALEIRRVTRDDRDFREPLWSGESA